MGVELLDKRLTAQGTDWKEGRQQTDTGSVTGSFKDNDISGNQVFQQQK